METFKPFTVDEKTKQIIIAPEEEWEKVRELERQCCLSIDDPWNVVDVEADLFETRNGYRIVMDEHDDSDVCVCLPRTATMSDILSGVFVLIDECPHLEFVLTTKWPERVRKNWPAAIDKNKCCMCDSDVTPQKGRVIHANGVLKVCSDLCWEDYADEDCEDIVRSIPRKWLKNVTVQVPCNTQTEADKRIPELLKLRDLVGKIGVVCCPSEEIRFDRMKWTPMYEMNCLKGVIKGTVQRYITKCEKIDQLTAIRGEEQHVKSIQKQCEEAGIAFLHEDINDWLTSLPNGEDLPKADVSWEDL